jgi:LytS/YehU family sensor histidine kinase
MASPSDALIRSVPRSCPGQIGCVRISGVRADGQLSLTIYNDAPDCPIDWEPPRTGLGLSNLRARLKILHGDDTQLDLRPADTRGTEVIVRLPFET